MKKLVFTLALICFVSITYLFTQHNVSAVIGSREEYVLPSYMDLTFVYATHDGVNMVAAPNTAGNLYFWAVNERIYFDYNFEEHTIFDTLVFDLPILMSMYTNNINFRELHLQNTVLGIDIVQDIYSTTASPTDISYTTTTFELERDFIISLPGHADGQGGNWLMYIIDDFWLNAHTGVTFADGYIAGQNDMFANGSIAYGYLYFNAYDYHIGKSFGQNFMYTYGSNALYYDPLNSFDYKSGKVAGLVSGELIGYNDGQNDMYDNGSLLYGFVPAGSYDYDVGFDVGASTNVNSGLINFTTGFEKWIVPAILLVILLGGFTTIIAHKQKNKGD